MKMEDAIFHLGKATKCGTVVRDQIVPSIRCKSMVGHNEMAKEYEKDKQKMATIDQDFGLHEESF